MHKELVILYDTPSMTHQHIMGFHSPASYLKYFNKVHITYWAKDDMRGRFTRHSGKLIFYPYKRPYDSGYGTGLRYMFWIARTLWRISSSVEGGCNLIVMPVMPLWPGLPALIVARMRGRKVVVRLEAHKIDYMQHEERAAGTLPYIIFLKLGIIKIIYRLTLPWYSDVIGISRGLVREAKHYGARNAHWLPIAQNLAIFFNTSNQLGHSYMSQRGEIRTLLYVGQLKAIKGPHVLIEAFKLLKQDGTPARLLIAGAVTNPRDEEYYQKLVSNARGMNIEFLGWTSHDQLPELYARADVLIVPSFTEALGLVIMEAMASGLPVIASDLSGPQDLVEDGTTGFLVEPGSPTELQEKMEILLRSSSLRESMGRAGRERIQEFMDDVDRAHDTFWANI